MAGFCSDTILDELADGHKAAFVYLEPFRRAFQQLPRELIERFRVKAFERGCTGARLNAAAASVAEMVVESRNFGWDRSSLVTTVAYTCSVLYELDKLPCAEVDPSVVDDETAVLVAEGLVTLVCTDLVDIVGDAVEHAADERQRNSSISCGMRE